MKGKQLLTNGAKFAWMLTEGDTPEIYGFIEDCVGDIVPRTSGWYSTNIPIVAARTAAAAFGYTVQFTAAAESEGYSV